MNEHADKDKVGGELAAQRFRMLDDVAREMAGGVVFPTGFDTVLRLRKELQNANLTIARVASIVSVEPLKLVRLANSAAYAAPGREVLELPLAINRLRLNVVRATALAIAMTQILHAKDMVAYASAGAAYGITPFRGAVGARLLAHTYPGAIPTKPCWPVWFMIWGAICYIERPSFRSCGNGPAP